MTIAFNYYRLIKNRICLTYAGNSPEYLVQLRMLRRSIEAKYPNVSLTYTCKNQYYHYLETDKQAITLDKYKPEEYAYTISVVYNANERNHPILSLFQGIPILGYDVGKPVSYNGFICPEGNYPNESLTEKQIANLKTWITGKGLKPTVLGTAISETQLPIDQRIPSERRRDMARKAGFVVGVECDLLYEAIEAGVPTAVVAGYGEEMYKLLCNKPIVLNI